MVRIVGVILVYIFTLFVVGCARVHPIYDENGNVVSVESYGFLRNVRMHAKKTDGSELTIESSSTTGAIIGGVNEILGTVTGTTKEAF